MSKVVVIGISGEAGLWLADISKGTITALNETPSGDLGDAVVRRNQGLVSVKGVDLAIAVSTPANVAAGVLE